MFELSQSHRRKQNKIQIENVNIMCVCVCVCTLLYTLLYVLKHYCNEKHYLEKLMLNIYLLKIYLELTLLLFLFFLLAY